MPSTPADEEQAALMRDLEHVFSDLRQNESADERMLRELTYIRENLSDLRVRVSDSARELEGMQAKIHRIDGHAKEGANLATFVYWAFIISLIIWGTRSCTS